MGGKSSQTKHHSMDSRRNTDVRTAVFPYAGFVLAGGAVETRSKRTPLVFPYAEFVLAGAPLRRQPYSSTRNPHPLVACVPWGTRFPFPMAHKKRGHRILQCPRQIPLLFSIFLSPSTASPHPNNRSAPHHNCPPAPPDPRRIRRRCGLCGRLPAGIWPG